MAQRQDENDNLRSTLAQLLATLSLGALSFNCGLIICMPTIVIGALRLEDSAIKLTESEASWFGSLMFIVQPIGSILAGGMQEVLGRRFCLQLINAPQFIAWIVIYFSSSSNHLFIAVVLMGLSMGFLEAPVLSYIGETTQPRIRGVLSSTAVIFYNIGFMVETFIGAAFHWRTVVLCNVIGPVIGFIAMSLVPDSPAWLVTKGRVEDAQKAYQWLRGWVKPEVVQEELDAMITYVNQSQKVNIDNVQYTAVVTKEGSPSAAPMSRWKSLLQPQILTGFRIISIYFIIMACTSLFGLRPYFIEILASLNLPLKPHVVVAMCGGLQLMGAIGMGLAVRALGKRGLSFLSLSLSCVCCFGLGTYLAMHTDYPWVPVVLFCASYFVTTLGIIALPWVLIIELFPLRVRGLAGGICGAVGYVLMFLVTKTYYSLERLVGVAGVCFIFGGVGVLGMVYLYVDLPETEGVSLETIERQMSERRSSRRRSAKAGQ